METLTDGNLSVVVAGPAGYGNNIYILIDRETNEAAFVDAPGEPEKWLDAVEAAGVRPSKILLTHSHFDHTASIELLKESYGCTLYADAREPWLKEGQLDVPVSEGDEVAVGNLRFRVISNPGHTPGSVSYLLGSHVFVGDTLFPGGPGATRSNDDLQQEIASITTQLYALPDATVIYPGHGGRTTIGESKAEYAVFAAREHPSDLHGDVLWASS